MKSGSGRLVLLPVLACLLVLSVGAAAQAGDSGWLGVMLQPLDDEIKEAMDLEAGIEGVLISDVIDDGPADQAGIEDGDIIVMIGDAKTPTVKEAVDAVKSHMAGEKVQVVVLRDGKQKKIDVELGKRDPAIEKKLEKKLKDYTFVMPDMGKLPGMGKEFAHKIMKPHAYLGVRVTAIGEDLGDYFGVKAREGVLVIEVMNDSPAEYAGLKEGDVILEIDGKEIKGPDRLVKYVQRCEPGEKIEVTYKRQRRTKTVEVELEGAPGPAGFYWNQQGQGMCSCGDKDCRGECGRMHMNMGKAGPMPGPGCCPGDMSDCVRQYLGQCKKVGLKGGDGEYEMQFMGDDGTKKRIVIKTMGDDECCEGEGGKIIIKTDEGTKTIDLSGMDLDDLDLDELDLGDLDLDEIEGLHMYHLQDADDLRDEIKGLQKEIEELKKELEKLKKS